MNDKLIYWRRATEAAAMLASMLIMVFWKNAPPALAPGLQGFALMLGQSPVGNPATVVFKTKYPPPVDVTADAVRIPTIPAPPPDMTENEKP